MNWEQIAGYVLLGAFVGIVSYKAAGILFERMHR